MHLVTAAASRPIPVSGENRADAIPIGTPMRVILASASPRRAQILRDAGIPFEIARANVSERRKRGENAVAMTRRLAQAKAQAVARKLGKKHLGAIVVGADTTVEVKGELLGKPQSLAEASKMLRKLAGRTHRVVTSVAAIRLPDHAQAIATETTRVRFAPLSADDIAEYVATGDRKSTRLNSSHNGQSRMPSSA